jgi:hypothetical protein
MSEISLFGCILCCKALTLYLFAIVLVAAAVVAVAVHGVDFDFAVPSLSSNVPFPMHDFKCVFSIFTLNTILEVLSFIILLMKVVIVCKDRHYYT